MSCSRDSLRRTWHTLQANTRLRTALKAGILLFTVGFLVLLLIQGREELRQFDNWRAYLAVCGQGFLLYPLSLFAQAWVWVMMIARIGQVAGGWRDVEIYAYTHLMRRLPGAVWYLAGRAMIYRERGIRASLTLAASGLELLLLLAVAASLAAALSLPGRSSWLVAPAVLALLVLVIPRALVALPSASKRSWVPRFARDRLANLSAAATPTRGEFALWIGLYTMAYLVGAFILFLLIRSVAPESGLTFTTATRIWALSVGIASVVSMIIPAGMGIPELTLTALLSPYLPMAGALLIAVLVRLLFIASDLVWGGLMWVTARGLGRRQSRAD